MEVWTEGRTNRNYFVGPFRPWLGVQKVINTIWASWKQCSLQSLANYITWNVSFSAEDCKQHYLPKILSITILLFISLYSIVKGNSDTLHIKKTSHLQNLLVILKELHFDEKVSKLVTISFTICSVDTITVRLVFLKCCHENLSLLSLMLGE